MVKNLWPS